MAILNSKRVQLDKTTRTMVISVAVAVFITLFCILSAHSLTTVLAYQNRVINKQTTAHNTLSQDITANKQLDSAYSKFNNLSGNNLLGASSTGTGPNQGDNAKLVLDALPSVDDYPAMVVSMQNLFANQGVSVSSISVTNTNTSTSSAPTAAATASGSTLAPIPISFAITGPLGNIESFINHINTSILPIQFLTESFSGNQSALTMNVSAQTFYQPATAFNVTTETVK